MTEKHLKIIITVYLQLIEFNIRTSPCWFKIIFQSACCSSQKLKLPSGKTLKGNERQLFEIHRIKTDVSVAELLTSK